MIGLQVVIDAKIPKRHNMVNVQAFAVLILMHAASLAGVIVSLACVPFLFIPVWATIFGCAWNDLRQRKTATRTKSAVVFQLRGIAYKVFAADTANTIHGIVAGMILSFPKRLLALHGTKYHCGHSLRDAALKVFPAMMTSDFNSILAQHITTFQRTGLCLALSEVLWLKKYSAYRAWNFSVITLALSGAALRILTRWGESECLSAGFTNCGGRFRHTLLAQCCRTRFTSSRQVRNRLTAITTQFASAVIKHRKTPFSGLADVLAEGTRVAKERRRQQYRLPVISQQNVFPQRLNYTTGGLIGETL